MKEAGKGKVAGERGGSFECAQRECSEFRRARARKGFDFPAGVRDNDNKIEWPPHGERERWAAKIAKKG